MVNGSATRSTLSTNTRSDGSPSEPSTRDREQNKTVADDDDNDDDDDDDDYDDGDDGDDGEKREEEELEGEEEELEGEEEEEGGEEEKGEKRNPIWIEYLTSLERASREYKSKSKLPNGTYVEDILADYAETLEPLDVAHWMIIDSHDACLKARLLSNGWGGVVEGHNFSLPQLPEVLYEHISKYENVW